MNVDNEELNFVHLHVHTEYSLLDGASRIERLIIRAKELGMPAVAITDHGSMYGAVDFYKHAKRHGINPIIGCEVYVAPRSRFEKSAVEGEAYYHLVLLAENNTGYKNLVEIVSRGYTEGFYYKPRVDRALLRQYSQGIICLSACIAGEVPAYFLKGDTAAAEQIAAEYKEIFGADNFFLEVQDHGIPEQKKVNEFLRALSRKLNIGLVATNDLHYINKADSDCHDVLMCIQMGKTVDDQTRMKFPSNEFYLKSAQQMDALFAGYDGAIANTVKIARRCNVEFEFGKLHLPEFPLSPGISPDEHLRCLCESKLTTRFAEITPAVTERLEFELAVISKMGYASYFLIVWDFIEYARQNKIAVGPGRGSAAGSIVAYLLAITNIDPLKYGLLFERFLNPERVTMPDIDIDFCYVKRAKVIEYVSERYGADHVAQIITFGTMAAKAAVRDVGRALNMSYGEVDRVAKMIPNELGMTLDKALKHNAELKGAYQSEQQVAKLLDLARALEGLPRHASTHAAGLVISKEPLTAYVPLQNSADGFVTTQYDKDRVEDIGLLKMDLLGLRTLTVIGDALELIQANRGIELDLETIPLKDDQVAAMLASGDTSGVFQMESSGMTSLVKELKPEGFDDLIPLVALYRPGPLGSGMVDDFIKGRHGRKVVTYLHPLLEPILKETFGVILYQEQVMQIAAVMAGFSLGQADLLRRAMGKKKHSVLDAQRDNFLLGAAERSIDGKLAAEIFDLMAHFADYGFNKSHSAAYALVAYQTAYLKAHYPQEFMAALLSSVMGANDKIGGYIEQCRRMGIAVLPPDVNASKAAFSVDGQAIRFGLAAVKNVGENAIHNLIEARNGIGRFKSLIDFCTQIDMRLVNKRVLESLIKCGAFDGLGAKRSQLLAVLERAVDVAASRQRDAASGQLGLFAEDAMDSADELVLPPLEEIPQQQLLALEKEMTGFYITGHPLDAYREAMSGYRPLDCLTPENFVEGQVIRVAGLVGNAKRIVTKRGETMCFVDLEDFAGQVEVVVFPRMFDKCHHLLIPDMPIAVVARCNVGDDSVKLIAEKITSIEECRPEVRLRIYKSQENSETFDLLKQVLLEHQGQSVVYLHLVQSKRVIKTEAKFWVEPDEQVIDNLERILGKGAVQVI